MKGIEDFKESDEWMRSYGIGILKIHFREKNGTGHAICNREDGSCSVHYDDYNPHDDFFAHIWNDSPQVVYGGVLAGALSIFVTAFLGFLRERIDSS